MKVMVLARSKGRVSFRAYPKLDRLFYWIDGKRLPSMGFNHGKGYTAASLMKFGEELAEFRKERV